jgi:hypothetical protein
VMSLLIILLAIILAAALIAAAVGVIYVLGRRRDE